MILKILSVKLFVAVGGAILKILQGGPEFEVTPLRQWRSQEVEVGANSV